jgi:hypothetical protein
VNNAVAKKSFSSLKQEVGELQLDDSNRCDEMAKLVISLCELVLETKLSGFICGFLFYEFTKSN